VVLHLPRIVRMETCRTCRWKPLAKRTSVDPVAPVMSEIVCEPCGQIKIVMTKSEEQRLREEAASSEHKLLLAPKHVHRDVCNNTKPDIAQARRRGPDQRDVQPKVLGDALMADRLAISFDGRRGRCGEKAGLIV
jgi:hypothetical protein